MAKPVMASVASRNEAGTQGQPGTGSWETFSQADADEADGDGDGAEGGRRRGRGG